MCGIAGLIDPGLRGNADALLRQARTMADAIAHRGPDGSGAWCEAESGVALSHRRLSIIDLTETGAQPMLSEDGRWVMSYNGEIYNARDMAREPALSSHTFRGTSDTEAIVESIARRGLDVTLADLNGMFAIALWDRRDKILYLIRDRLGIKPLFFAARDGKVSFASELKAMTAHGVDTGGIDPASAASFLRFGYVPAPFSIYRHVEKVMPGEVIAMDAYGTVDRRQFWSLADVLAQGKRTPFAGSDREAIDALHDLLADAVSRQMMSDVPLGAFLSGGIDSSIIAALMVAADKGPVHTFSIGFPELGFDESRYAAAVAAHLGTHHEQLVVTAHDAIDVVPRLAEIYDEPFADSSQIPTFLVSKLTRRRVTVALSGDGGDELFAGYNRYLFAERLASGLARLPMSLRRAGAAVLHAIPPDAVDRIARFVPLGLLPAQPGDKLGKVAEILPLDPKRIYLRLVSLGGDPSPLVPGVAELPVAWLSDDFDGDLVARMQAIDTATYLPDDILQKVDRAAMAVALEVRPPLLDHRVLQFAASLPRGLCIRGSETKWLLRQVLDLYVPRRLIERPKMGFGIPLNAWLRGPLREWGGDLLNSTTFGGGIVDLKAARAIWSEHQSGRRNRAYALWNVLMFESWRQRWAG